MVFHRRFIYIIELANYVRQVSTFNAINGYGLIFEVGSREAIPSENKPSLNPVN